MRSRIFFVVTVVSIVLNLQIEAYSESRNIIKDTNKRKAIVKMDSMPLFSLGSNNREAIFTIDKGKSVYIKFILNSESGTWCAISEAIDDDLIGFVDCNALQFEQWPGSDYTEISQAPVYSKVKNTENPANKSLGVLRPKIKQNKNWPALVDAAWQGKPDTIRNLIKGGVDINARDKESGLTALMAAAAYGSTDVIDLLISAGAKINTKDNYGWSAIMIASEKGNLNAVKALLKKGATISNKDFNGFTAADLAERNGHTKIVKFLRKNVDTKQNK